MISYFQNIALIEEDKDHICKWVKETCRLDHDQNLLPHILPLIPKGGIVVDGGAYIGDMTCAFIHAVGPEGVVYAFEPNPEPYECLKHNCRSAVCIRFGLSDAEGNMGMHVDPNNIGASRMIETGEPGTIQVIPLDKLRLQRLDLFKLDVEGMEEKALRGAEKTIERLRPKILIELNWGTLAHFGSDPPKVVSYLESLGYQISNAYAGHPLNLDEPQIEALALPT